MTDMVVLAFDGEETAEKVKNRLLDLNKQYLLQLGQVVEVVRKPDGQVKIKEEPRLTSYGAVGGGFWGLLIGLIFLVPAAGFVVGAVSGAIMGHFAKYGITKDYMQEIDAAIQPGQSALFVLADNPKMDRLIPELKEYHPKVLRTSLSLEQEAKLREAFGGSTSAPMTVPTATV